MYGVIIEHFAFSEEIRNERYSRIEDGKGYAIGDFYFSTLIQLLKTANFQIRCCGWQPKLHRVTNWKAPDIPIAPVIFSI
jgi:hypothetical protein